MGMSETTYWDEQFDRDQDMIIFSDDQPSDDQLINYYSRSIVEYVDKYGYEEKNIYPAKAYALRKILKKWGNQ